MYGHRYDVPLVLTDCAPAEAISQCLDNLERLDNVIDDLFKRISARIQTEKATIQTLSGRIDRAAVRVQAISNHPNRATTLFSAPKYPAKKVLNDYESVSYLEQATPFIGSSLDSRLCMNDVTEKEKFLENTNRAQHRLTADNRFAPSPAADVSVLFTSLSRARLIRTDHVSDEQAEGLGRLPAYLPSISSILLFNSDENPYKKYTTVNNLEGIGGQDRAIAESGPAAAPKSIIEGSDLPSFTGFQFEYKPSLGDLPTFDLPANLPLGMLADINFGVDSASIAPSVSNSLNLPTLEQLAPIISTVPTATLPSPSAIPLPPSGPIISNNAPPPPPPMAPNAPPMVAPDAPPPPPPPSDDISAPPSAPSPSSDDGGGRNSLLEAIRNAGKSRPLRNANDPRPAKKGGDAKKKPAASEPMDMMADLRARLERRKGALSGKSETKTASAPLPAASEQRTTTHIRLPSSLPRLGDDDGISVSSLASPKSEPEGDGEDGDKITSIVSKPSSSVMNAYMAMHQKKAADDDEWD